MKTFKEYPIKSGEVSSGFFGFKFPKPQITQMFYTNFTNRIKPINSSKLHAIICVNL